MDADIARLGIEVDATQAVEATRALEALARASGDAERATQRLGRGQPWQALATDAPRGDRGGAEPVAGLVESQKTATEGAHVLGRAMASAFDQAAFKGKGLRDVVAGLAEDLQRMALRDTVRGAVDGALGGGLLHGLGAALAGAFSFAGGGVMTREGPLPLRRYAGGGVADSPQLALFGEGRQPEAYVPLPDGRSIPVTVTGAERGVSVVNHITVNTPDADSFRRSESQIGAEIAARLQRHLRRNG